MRPVRTNSNVQGGAVVARSRAYGLMITLALALCAVALPVQAQIAFRAAGPQSSGTGASITATIPAGVQSGDFAVLVIAGRPTNTTQPSAPTGWTLRSSSLREVGANDLKIMTFYRVLGASNPNPVVSLPSAWQGNAAGMSAQIVVWSGVNTTTPFDVADVTGNAAAATQWTPPAITTATNGARIVSVVATSDDNALSVGTAQGFTARMSGTNYDTITGGDHSVGLADKPQPTAGTVSLLAWNQAANASDHWAGITFALRPAPINAAPTVTLTSPVDGAHYGTNVPVSATASDSDGTISFVEFTWFDTTGDSASVTVAQAPYTTAMTVPLLCGSSTCDYWFTAKAFDNQGGVGVSNSVSVTVSANTPPTVTITSPVANATFAAPASIGLSAQAGDSDGTVSKVEFYNGANLITTITSPPYTFNWTGMPQGSYSLTARATDNLGAVTSSASVNVTVTPGVALHFIHVDHLNTPRLISDSTGTAVWKWDQQEPFGVSPPDTNPSSLGVFEFPLRFAGQYDDKETGLFYNYFRDCYDPVLGRYCEPDPIGLQGGINVYAYVDNNPLSKIDPLGLMGQGNYSSLTSGWPAKQQGMSYDYECWLKCVAIKEIKCVPFRIAGAAFGAVTASVVTGPPTLGGSLPASITYGGMAGGWAGRAVCEIVMEDCQKQCSKAKQCVPSSAPTLSPNATPNGNVPMYY